MADPQLVCPTVEKSPVDFFRSNIRHLAKANALEIKHFRVIENLMGSPENGHLMRRQAGTILSHVFSPDDDFIGRRDRWGRFAITGFLF